MNNDLKIHCDKAIRGLKLMVSETKRHWQKDRELASVYSMMTAIVHQHLAGLGIDANEILNEEFTDTQGGA